VPSDAVLIWAWLASNAPTRGTVWFDDASLEVLGPARVATPAGPVDKPAVTKQSAR
jgi:hypothetical protein